VSELLEPAGAGQQRPGPLPHSPGADPAEDPPGEASQAVEGLAGTSLVEWRSRSALGHKDHHRGLVKALGTHEFFVSMELVY
jgi:hypothetical protein